MFDSECKDYRLQHYLRSIIGELPYSQQLQLKTISLCNVNLVPHSAHLNYPDGVFLAVSKNHDKAKFIGQITCKNPYVCPHCSAVRMAHYASKIGSAIDMYKEKGLFGFMVTFTIPHLSFQHCNEVVDVLHNAWRSTFANAYARRKSKSKGNECKFSSPVNKFFIDCDVKNYVRVSEATFGKNGWHPHFHCIFWVPKNKADLVLNYEKDLEKHWQKNVLKAYKQYWEVKNLHADKRDYLYNYIKKDLENINGRAVFISKTREQKVLESLSSDYISGWGANAELTGNVRKEASHNCHYTPHQILELAADHKSAPFLENPKDTFIEFALAMTRKPVHQRVKWSKPINKDLAIYRNTNGYKEAMRKKKESPDWRVVAFFSKEQWSSICIEDRSSPIISNIIYLAKHHEDLLADFLRSFGIDMHLPDCYTDVQDILNGKNHKEALAA